jgi:RND family efflux transporter MFP subunit
VKLRSLMLLSVALLASGCKDEEAVETAVSSEVRPVKTVVARAAELPDDRVAIGEIRPRRSFDLSFRVAGKLTSRTVDVGAYFRKGDVLARIDDEEYRHRFDSAEADLAAAKAVQAEAGAAFQRQRKLYHDGYTTRANYDAALKSLKSAEAKLDSAAAASALAKSQLSYTELRADFDGIVTDVAAEEGQVVNTGQMVIRAAEPDLRDAVFSVPEAAFGGSGGRAAANVIVSLLSDPSISVRGRVRETAPMADAATGTYEVRISLDTPSAAMRFGAAVSGRLDLKSDPVFLLPGGALTDQRGAPAVWVVDGNTATVHLQSVEVARYETDRVVVSSGISTGDLIVAAGVSRLREDQKVLINERME